MFDKEPKLDQFQAAANGPAAIRTFAAAGGKFTHDPQTITGMTAADYAHLAGPQATAALNDALATQTASALHDAIDAQHRDTPDVARARRTAQYLSAAASTALDRYLASAADPILPGTTIPLFKPSQADGDLRLKIVEICIRHTENTPRTETITATLCRFTFFGGLAPVPDVDQLVRARPAPLDDFPAVALLPDELWHPRDHSPPRASPPTSSPPQPL
jgi:hypothetical protein